VVVVVAVAGSVVVTVAATVVGEVDEVLVVVVEEEEDAEGEIPDSALKSDVGVGVLTEYRVDADVVILDGDESKPAEVEEGCFLEAVLAECAASARADADGKTGKLAIEASKTRPVSKSTRR
jgi:hypothetical protein